MEAGSFPLTGVGPLPNVSTAFPGEHWSDRVASGAITPGEAIVPAGSATPRGLMVMERSPSNPGNRVNQIAIALRPVDHPDPDGILGPNEIRNQEIADGEYVRALYSGVFHLTLVVPDTYVPGDPVGWDADAARPAGKGDGPGAWKKNAVEDLLEVVLWRPVNEDNEGVLTARWINRSQM